jgi:hypothetical protein
MQTNLHLHIQLTKTEWDTLLRKETPYWSKVMTLVKRKRALGDVFSSETSYCHAAGLLTLVCQPQGESFRVEPEQFYRRMCDLKREARLVRKHSARSQYDGKILVFPPSMQELKESCPDLYNMAYPNEGPAGSQVSEPVLERLRLEMPSRRSHSAITFRTQCHGAITAGKNMGTSNRFRSNEDDIPGLKIYGTAGSVFLCCVLISPRQAGRAVMFVLRPIENDRNELPAEAYTCKPSLHTRKFVSCVHVFRWVPWAGACMPAAA